MAGDWQVRVTVQPPESAALRGTVDFTADTGALDVGRLRRFEPAAVMISSLNVFSCVLACCWLPWPSSCCGPASGRRLPLWSAPVGLVLFACGAALCLRVVLVDAYPTSYVGKPAAARSRHGGRGTALFKHALHALPRPGRSR